MNATILCVIEIYVDSVAARMKAMNGDGRRARHSPATSLTDSVDVVSEPIWRRSSVPASVATTVTVPHTSSVSSGID